MLNDKEQIKEWLDSMGIKNYTINDDFTVDVDGKVNLSTKKLTNIPVQFGNIKEFFSCSYNQLTNLKGSPKFVGDGFYCHENQLTTLEHSPQSIGGNFNCDENQLTSLQGCPEHIGGFLSCNNNNIQNLNDFNCKFLGIFYHRGYVIKEFSHFYLNKQLSLTHKEIENIKLNNKLNNTLKNKKEAINKKKL